MSKSELPSLTIEGERGTAFMRWSYPPNEREMTERDLVALLDALPGHQLLRVLETNGFTLPAKLRALQLELKQERAGRVRAEARIAELEAQPRSLLRDPVHIDLSKVTPEQLARGAAVHRSLREPCTVHNLDERGFCIKCERLIRPHVPGSKKPDGEAAK